MRVSTLAWRLGPTLNRSRIVEYATREQAQSAVSTLSNQNLMGRLVYVREVSSPRLLWSITVPVFDLWSTRTSCTSTVLTLHLPQDRESEPRFTGPPSARGGYESGPPRGGYGGGYGGGAVAGYGGGPPASGGGRQIFVNNVCRS